MSEINIKVVYDTNISYISHIGRQRPWGYEIPITFYHVDGREFNQILLFRDGKIPDAEQLSNTIDFWVDKINNPIEDTIDVITEDGTNVD